MRPRYVFLAILAILLSIPACAPAGSDMPAATLTVEPMPTSTATPTTTPTPAPEYLTEEIPPCTPVSGSSVDPCDPDAPPFEGGIAQSHPELGGEPLSLRKMLDGVTSPPAWVTHLVVRGTYLPGTVRCSSGDPLRSPSYLRDYFGDTTGERSVKCYADLRANAYILGSGAATLTALLFKYHYWDGEYYPSEEEGQTEEDLIEEMRQQIETAMDGLFSGREHVLFLGPAVDLSSEAWRVMGFWDVQRREDDTVVAVHPERDLWRRLRPDDYQAHRSALEMELPSFTQAVTSAHQARVTEYGGRIGEDASLPMLVTDANQLESYFREVGAYDNPNNPPAQPPP